MKNNLLPSSHPVWPYAIIVLFFLLFAFRASAAVQVEDSSAQIISGHKIYTWDRMADGQVVEVGITIPFPIIDSPPPHNGAGPAGAIAVVEFSRRVRDTTFLNHFELHWEKDGHEPPVFMVPHFDFHFFSIPAEEVRKISLPDPSPPRTGLIPAGYVYPGAEFTVPQMGVHAFRPADLERPFADVLIFGYYGGKMTFIEPMATQAALLQQRNIDYTLPIPAAMGIQTRFPTKFRLEHDKQARACRLVFSDFVTTTPYPPAAGGPVAAE